MSRSFVWVALVCLTGCATSEVERRSQTLAQADQISREEGRKDPMYPELLFKVSLERVEQASALSGDAARAQLERVVDDLSFVIDNYPSYARLGEAKFWRAEALSALGRWPEALEAWRAVPRQKHPDDQRRAQQRLQQAIKATQ